MKKLEFSESFKYMYVCTSANDNEEDEDLEERIKTINLKIEKNFIKLSNDFRQEESFIKAKFQSIEHSIEAKISSVETKISFLEEKIENKLNLLILNQS